MSTTTQTREPTATRAGGLLPALMGLGAALVSVACFVVPSVTGWLTERGSTGSVGGAAATGVSFWLLAHGARLVSEAGALSVLPLVLVLLPVAVAVHGARAVAREAAADWADASDSPGSRGSAAPDAAWSPRPVLTALGLWCAGYSGVGLLLVALALPGPLHPVLWTCLGVVLLPLLAAAVGVGLAAREYPALLGPRLRDLAPPDWFTRSLRPGLRAAGGLLAVGTVLAAVLIAVHFGRVEHLQSQLGAGVLGGALLWVLQLAALPNLGLWAVSFLAGPGFQVVQGAETTWSGSQSGLLPMVPVLAALPEPGSFPVVTIAAVLVPVGVGVWLGRACLAALPRLARGRTKLAVAASGVVVAAGSLALLDGLGGGALGRDRLAAVGAPAGWLFLALVVEFGLGALPVVAWDAWKHRR